MLIISTFQLAAVGVAWISPLLTAVGGAVVLLAAFRAAERYFK